MLQPCDVCPASLHRVLNIMGIQDHVMQDECAMVHDRSMTATENLQAVKHGNHAEGMPTKHGVKDDGTLSNFNLGKLNKSLSTFADAARDMEAQLIIATTNSHIISHELVQRFAAVKCELDAESAGLQLYKENNREEDTVNVVKAAMDKLNQARKQFKIMKKMLNILYEIPMETRMCKLAIINSIL